MIGIYAGAEGSRAMPGLVVGTVPGRVGGISRVGVVEPAFSGVVPDESETCDVAWCADAGVVAWGATIELLVWATEVRLWACAVGPV